MFLYFCGRRELDLFAVLVAEVGEGVELIEDTTNCFGFGEVATTGDLHDISILGGMDRLPIRALPGAVVDFVGGGEALVVFSVGFGDFDAGHRFGAVSGFRDWVCSGLV